MGSFAPFFVLQLSKQYVPEDKSSLPIASGEGPAKCSHLVTRGKSIEKIGSKEGWLTSFTTANEWGLDFGAVAIHALSDRYQTSRGHPCIGTCRAYRPTSAQIMAQGGAR